MIEYEKEIMKNVERYLDRKLVNYDKEEASLYKIIEKSFLMTKIFNTDFNILIFGLRGMGKSTFALFLLDLIRNSIKDYYQFDYYLIRDREDLYVTCLELRGNLEEFFKKDRYLLLIFDEAGRTIYKRDFATKKNIWFVKLIKIIRPLNASMIYVTQKLSDLDKDLRNEDVFHMAFFIPKRGLAWMYSRDITTKARIRSSLQYLFRNYENFDEMASFSTEEFLLDLRQRFPPLYTLKFTLPSRDIQEEYEEKRRELIMYSLDDLITNLEKRWRRKKRKGLKVSVDNLKEKR